MSKMNGHGYRNKGPATTPPRPDPRKRPAKVVDRKPLQVPQTRHPKTFGSRRHAKKGTLAAEAR